MAHSGNVSNWKKYVPKLCSHKRLTPIQIAFMPKPSLIYKKGKKCSQTFHSWKIGKKINKTMKSLLAFHARRRYLLQWTTSWLLRSLQSKSSSPFPTCENVIFPILRNYQLLRLDHWGRPSIKDIFPRKLHHSQKGTHGLCTQKPFLGSLEID